MKYWIFNLKSKLTFDELVLYEQKVNHLKDKIIIAPSYPYLKYLKDMNYTVASQDVSSHPIGNYTGDVNATQLSSLGVDYVIIGHFERIKYYQEDDLCLVNKIKHSTDNNIKVILCIDNIDRLKSLFAHLDDEQRANLIIAYEPSKYISSDIKISSNEINNDINQINDFTLNNYNIKIPCIYGGSVNINNLDELKKINCDGFIIGDASTNIEEINKLVIDI